MFLVWVAVAAVGSILAAYASVLGFVYVRQRAILYLPRRVVVAPGDRGLTDTQTLDIPTADGERIVGWYVAPRSGKPLLIYFHGNASCLADISGRFRLLSAGGAGVLAVDYRGFGGSSGEPTETGLHHDADAAYAAAVARGMRSQDIVVVGESLGSGVAVALATRKPVAGVVLVSPFTSAMAIAAHRFPLLPVRWLMLDPFRSDRIVHQLQAPLLIIHGTADQSIPLRFGRALYARAPDPKSFEEIEGGGHDLLHLQSVAARIEAWTASLR